jgi:hypothetical protein
MATYLSTLAGHLPKMSVKLAIAVFGISFIVYRILKIGSREEGLPPGPPTVPIFGNMLQIPITQTERQ